jgi:hypothetical protein
MSPPDPRAALLVGTDDSVLHESDARYGCSVTSQSPVDADPIRILAPRHLSRYQDLTDEDGRTEASHSATRRPEPNATRDSVDASAAP